MLCHAARFLQWEVEIFPLELEWKSFFLTRYEEAEVRKKLEEKERQEEQQFLKKQDLKDDTKLSAKTSSDIPLDSKGKTQVVIGTINYIWLLHWKKLVCIDI